MHTLCALVSAGLGVSVLPSAVANASPSDIVFRPLTGRSPRLPLDIVWRQGDLTPAGARFVEVAGEVSGISRRHVTRRMPTQ